jgi:hypothetical protein
MVKRGRKVKSAPYKSGESLILRLKAWGSNSESLIHRLVKLRWRKVYFVCGSILCLGMRSSMSSEPAALMANGIKPDRRGRVQRMRLLMTP